MMRPASRPRGNSSANNTQPPPTSPQPTHIALPPQPSAQSFTSGFTRSRSRPSTPSSPSGPSGSSADYGFGPTSPSLASGSPRQGFLSSLMSKTRPRGSTLSRNAASSSVVPTIGSGSGDGEGAAGGSLGGRVAVGLGFGAGGSGSAGGLEQDASGTGATGGPSTSNQNPTNAPTHRIRLVPHLESYRSLHFDAVLRDLVACPPGRDVSSGAMAGTVLKIGRFTDKTPQNAVEQSGRAGAGTVPPAPQPVPVPQPTALVSGGVETSQDHLMMDTSNDHPAYTSQPAQGPTTQPYPQTQAQSTDRAGAGVGGNLTTAKVAFKSKVVSRGHAEIWCEGENKFFIKDIKSSSGTFLNHIRLSNPNQESKPFAIKDGDVIQLGVDYQGGTEEMYRCVKMKVEVGRERQRGQQNTFNKEAMKQLKALGGVPDSPAPTSSTPTKGKPSASVTDCCICLFSVAVQQALFIAPCSHVFHYKCIRPLLQIHHPGFSCPLCRSFHDLEADVETEDAWEVASRRHSVRSRPASVAPNAQPGFAGMEDSDIPPVPSLPDGAGPTSPDNAGGDMNVDQMETRFVSGGEHPAFDFRAEQATPLAEHPDPFARSSQSPASPGSASRPIMSLGALPVPGIGGYGSHHSSDYASLDAATPMNTTFLSTLADGGGLFGAPGGITNGVALGPATGSGGRASLELVAEGDEMDAETVQNVEGHYGREPSDRNDDVI